MSEEKAGPSCVADRLKSLLKRHLHSVIELIDEADLDAKPLESGDVLIEVECRAHAYVVMRIPLVPLKDLTEREREIVRRAGRGLTNKEIGLALGISAATVATHLRPIFRKLGVGSRVGLAGFAVAIPPDPPSSTW